MNAAHRLLSALGGFAGALMLVGPALATAPSTALDAAGAAFGRLGDYRMTIMVHETNGKDSEDRTYRVAFKKPLMEKIDIISGPGRGGGIVWLGGDKVKGHRGGFLGAIHMTLDLHNGQVTTLRGDSVDTATIPSMLADFTRVKGTVHEDAGPQIDGAATIAVTLDVADSTTYGGVSREVLYLSDMTHLPVRRERFSGDTLVKSENVTEMHTDVGLTANDFPW